MKSRLYYVLYFLYVIVVAFVLYLNGVFTGEEISVVNLSINIGFLIVIGIVFIISSVSFGRLNRIIYDLEDAAIRLQKEYKESGGKNLWGNYKDNAKVFEESVLQEAFHKYRLRVKSTKSRRSAATDAPCLSQPSHFIRICRPSTKVETASIPIVRMGTSHATSYRKFMGHIAIRKQDT